MVMTDNDRGTGEKNDLALAHSRDPGGEVVVWGDARVSQQDMRQLSIAASI